MEYDDNYSCSEDDNYSLYSDYSNSQDDFATYDDGMDSLLNICEIHFPYYTPEQISAYILSLHPNTLQTLIQGIYDYSQIKKSISYLRVELEKFHHPIKTQPQKTTPIKYTKIDYLRAAFNTWKHTEFTKYKSQLSATAIEFYPQSQSTGKAESIFHTKSATFLQSSELAYKNSITLLPKYPNKTDTMNQTNITYVTNVPSSSPNAHNITKTDDQTPSISPASTDYLPLITTNDSPESIHQLLTIDRTPI